MENVLRDTKLMLFPDTERSFTALLLPYNVPLPQVTCTEDILLVPTEFMIIRGERMVGSIRFYGVHISEGLKTMRGTDNTGVEILEE